MFHLALWTLKGSATSQQLDQTLLTEGVGAGQEPRCVGTTVLVFLQTNSTDQQILWLVRHRSTMKNIRLK